MCSYYFLVYHISICIFYYYLFYINITLINTRPFDMMGALSGRNACRLRNNFQTDLSRVDVETRVLG